MKVKELPIEKVIPYEMNAKIHTNEQVDIIANSIEQFGWKQPIVVDREGVVVVGHGRLQAAKKLKLKTVPVVVAEDLSDEEIRAYRIADNKANESEWDFRILKHELEDMDFDMSDFGIDFSDFDEDEDDYTPTSYDERDPSCQHNVFEGQETRQFPIDNWYGIPIMKPTQTIGDKFLRFMDWKEIDDPSEYIAHFYYDDYKFISAYREPNKYIDRLRQFKAVISPDFSLYTDFPRALQILSCYRRQWCGAYWQELGIDVIPDVVWGDEESFKFCFEGLPKGGTVAVSSVGVVKDKTWNNKEGDLFKKGYEEMMKRLEPATVLFYGDMIQGLEGNIIQIPSYYAEKRAMLNELSRLKKNG